MLNKRIEIMSNSKQTLVLLSPDDIQNAFINALSLFFKSGNNPVESNTNVESKRLSHKEASKVLGVSETTLTKWRYAGLVPFYQLKARGTVFYDLEELKEAFKQEPKLTKYSRK